MSRIVTFDSQHGPIHFEVDDTGSSIDKSKTTDSGLVPKGGAQQRSKPAPIKSDTHFERAMSSLQAYAGSVQDIVQELANTPKEVTVEVGLKLVGEAGFFAIAKAGTEAEMRVKLSWRPGSKAHDDA